MAMDTYFTSCADAYSRGYANIKVGQPGYRIGLDADHDGLACDKPSADFTPHPTSSPTTSPHSTPPTISHSASPSKPVHTSPSHTKTTSAAAGVHSGTGPQLPLTGPGEAVGGGLVLAIVGVAVVMASRRRKRKFVA